MDNLIVCDRCGGNACYVQEVNHNIKNYMCYGCGFQTNSLMKKGEKYFDEQVEILPNLYKELMGEDDDGKIWMPSMVNLPTQGMVFANGPNASQWKWAAVKAIPVREEEKSKYPIPGKKGQFYEYRMDMETLKEFEEKSYMDALEYIGVFENTEE
tara:strand:- start:332 stop:796 length:465 start_codon:yes stop_codon:yes gene_type:complete